MAAPAETAVQGDVQAEAQQAPPAAQAARPALERSVDTVCPYCGVGCALTLHVRDDRVLYVEGRDGPANRGRLCVKGRYGFDYARHPQRLTVPLVRRDDAPKDPALAADPAAARAAFREASWDEALARAGGALRRLRDAHGPQALAGFGSAKGSNEARARSATPCAMSSMPSSSSSSAPIRLSTTRWRRPGSRTRCGAARGWC
jgi:anaerobic selenocysteine-containing dehydrogenase